MAEARRSSASPVKELTIRGIIIGGVITLVFTAANVYLGLKVGLTFATSIPAAVISMAILRFFKDHTVQENNIVQTIASAAGTLSAIIFVLPGLVIVGWWTGFDYWPTVLVCALGGLLGVMYSIPLRRALVTHSELAYPEGVAAAEVLRVGDSHGANEDNARGLKVIGAGAGTSAGFAILSSTGVASSSVSAFFRFAGGATTVGSSLSLALIGIGHLVGPAVGIAMIVGLVLSYFVFLPIWTHGEIAATTALSDLVNNTFSSDIRFIGAGVMAIAAVWTLVKIMGPIFGGMRDSLRSSRNRQEGRQVALEERDIPFPAVGLVILLTLIPIGLLLWMFVRDTALASSTGGIIVAALVFVLLAGMFIAAVCGYMAGLIGSSNSPISGVGILVALIAALLIKAVWGAASGDQVNALIAYTLFTSAVVFGIATISNDNLQDLKTGQLVGATPWKQQVALIIGVAFGSLIIPPIMGLMATSFGFQGAPGAGSQALAAPQAALIAALVQGVFGGSLDWSLLGTGALVGIGVVIVDEILKARTRFSLPPLAVGMGMYLPVTLTIMIPIGAFIGWFYDRWAARRRRPDFAKRLGVLLATGLIVGESLWGVVYAGIVGGTGSSAPLNLVTETYCGGPVVGIIIFVLAAVSMYRMITRMGRSDDAAAPAQVSASATSEE
ncbi:OPT family oligopeptide transporter [Neoactinobaculum massilliense]|uniref:OPT family oligopeptide transporter n=1 Tax=Neoactinobaculum massilliense TaxID=2364794 RepID=UPI001F14DDE6|nr:oligopeptide transporter, OPT family [Neoactinobaculum massilliense]